MKSKLESWSDWVNSDNQPIKSSVLGRLMDEAEFSGGVVHGCEMEISIEMAVCRMFQDKKKGRVFAEVLRTHYGAGNPRLLNMTAAGRAKSIGMKERTYYRKLTSATLELESMIA